MNENKDINNIVDLNELKDRLDGDKELFLDVSEAFFKDLDGHLNGISLGLKACNFEQIVMHVHTIKGALGNLSVKNAAECALNIEVKARSGNLNGLEQDLSQLSILLGEFREFVAGVQSGKIPF